MSSLLYHRAARCALKSLQVSKGQMTTQSIIMKSGISGRVPSVAQFNPQLQCVAFISTSKKDRETITPQITTTAQETKSEAASGTKKKTWQSLGYDWNDQDTDQNYANGIFFYTVTLGLVCSGFIIAYWPDHQLRNWSQREAHIELARREALGLPHIDPNYVPPESVYLPSEEELGDFEIII